MHNSNNHKNNHNYNNNKMMTITVHQSSGRSNNSITLSQTNNNTTNNNTKMNNNINNNTANNSNSNNFTSWSKCNKSSTASYKPTKETYNSTLHGSSTPLPITAYSKPLLLKNYHTYSISSSSNPHKHTISSICLMSSMHTIAHSVQITDLESHPLPMYTRYLTLKKRATS